MRRAGSTARIACLTEPSASLSEGLVSMYLFNERNA
jgi:hypothetical protein